MITKNDIIKMVRRIHRENQGLPPRRLIYPTREWAIGVFVFLVLVVVVCIIGALGYLYLTEIPNRVEPVAPSTVRYQDTAIDRTIELYQLRADRFAAFEQSVAITEIVDTAATSTERATTTATTSIPTATTTTSAVNNEQPAETVGEEVTPTLQAF